MDSSKFQLILTEPNGNFAIPDIEITNDFETAFSIQSVADISQRKDSISKSISFPGTKNNNRILNNLYSLNREADPELAETLYFNYSPVVGVRAVLYENNYPILSGLLRINDIAKDPQTDAFTYSGIITGNVVNFFGKLKDTPLSELDLFNTEVEYSWNNIINSWDFLDSKQYVLPSIDYGKGISPNATKMDIRNFRPGIYARWYLKKILAKYGYRYQSTFLDSDLFNRAYIPFSEVDFGKIVNGDVVTYTGGARGQQDMNRNDASTCLTGIFYADNPNAYVQLTEEGVHGLNGGWSRKTVYNDRTVSIFRFKKASNTGAVVDFNFDIFSHAKSTQVFVQLFEIFPYTYLRPPYSIPTFSPNCFNADTPLAEWTRGFGTEIKLNWHNCAGTISLPVSNYDKDFRFALVITTVTDKGDDLELRQQGGNKITIGNPDVTVGSIFSYDLGDTFNLNSAVPLGVKATDFLKSLFTVFNLYTIENPDDDKELIIEPYDLFYSKMVRPANYALDWTKKVDNSTLHIKINTALPQTYKFKFQSDTDFYNTLYTKTYGIGYGDYTIDNKIGTATPQDIAPSLFAATPIVTEDKDDKTYPAIFQGELLNKRPVKSKLRLLYNNGSARCQPYSVVLTKGVTGALVYENRVAGVVKYNTSHHVLNLAGTPLFNLLFALPKAVYYTVNQDVFTVPTLYSLYSKQLIELDDINIFNLELDVHLKDYDIARLDLTRPIFISTTQGIAYFKIMSVTYYNRNEPSKCVFQKLILT